MLTCLSQLGHSREPELTLDQVLSGLVTNSLLTTATRHVPVPTPVFGCKGFKTPYPYLTSTPACPADLVLQNLSRKEFLQDATSALGPFQLLVGRSFQGWRS